MFFSDEAETPCRGSGYQGRPNRVFGNALFFLGEIGFSGTSNGFSGNDSGYRERLHRVFRNVSGYRYPHRVFRNVSGYRERRIGVSGTSFSGYREHLIGVSGTALSSNFTH
jgi:hypothetical protein